MAATLSWPTAPSKTYPPAPARRLAGVQRHPSGQSPFVWREKPTGGKLELLVERVLTNHEVVAHMKVSKKPPVGTELMMAGGQDNGGFTATLLGRWPNEDGQLFRFKFSDEPHTLMQQHGHMPLPPYIERHQNTADAQHETEADKAEDERRYQTVFAKHPGAAAAPTAARCTLTKACCKG